MHTFSKFRCLHSETEKICLLWNYFYSWGSMLLGSQNVPGSGGRNCVGSVIGIILINIKQMIAYKFVGM